MRFLMSVECMWKRCTAYGALSAVLTLGTRQLYCILLFVAGVCVFGTIIAETNAVMDDFKVIDSLRVCWADRLVVQGLCGESRFAESEYFI